MKPLPHHSPYAMSITMKIVGLSLLLFASSASMAQNWQCLRSGVDRYFLNGSLRGIRIDSVKSINADSVIYPFRSPRGSYQPAMGFHQLDIDGGSWLGKKVTLQSDGIMTFDNLWGDTIFLNTYAGVGTSWMFYNDTTVRYYIATVTSEDTMSVLNTIDSVKTITLSAYSNNAINNNDLAHNQTLIISKHHGFVKVFSLYTFPFHSPASTGYQPFKDYLMDSRDIRNNSVISYYLYHLQPPDQQTVFDFNPGDVLKYEVFDGPGHKWITDTILTRTTTGAGLIDYTIKRVTDSWPNPPLHTVATITLQTTNNPLFTLLQMPEERANRNSVFIDPFDTSFCLSTPLYSLHDALYEMLDFESCYTASKHKTGLGRIYYYYCADPAPNAVGNIIDNLVRSYKNGILCDKQGPLGIESNTLLSRTSLRSFPNPVDDVLHIEVNHAGSDAYLRIIDTRGVVVFHQTSASGTMMVSTKDWAKGVYCVILSDQSGRTFVEKIIVQ